jgi:beta-glucanase (GH16 family)
MEVRALTSASRTGSTSAFRARASASSSPRAERPVSEEKAKVLRALALHAGRQYLRVSDIMSSLPFSGSDGSVIVAPVNLHPTGLMRRTRKRKEIKQMIAFHISGWHHAARKFGNVWLPTLLLLASGAASACAAPQDAAPDAKQAKRPLTIEKKGWTLTFHDEFDGNTLDRKKWIDSYPGNERTHSNNEQQYYAEDGWEVKDGILRFKAEKRAMGGMPYTSGMVSSYGKFAQEYGWFEIRAKFPKGKGMWPAFWLLPETKAWPPEIDVLEILGHEPDKVYMTNHWKNADGKHEYKGDSWKGLDFSADFHTFALEWSPDAIVWYVDDVERYRTTANVPHEPMYILANLAVGGDWPGMPDDATPFPGYMDIDYIRVYKKKEAPANR